jgi:hypothetical protein
MEAQQQRGVPAMPSALAGAPSLRQRLFCARRRSRGPVGEEPAEPKPDRSLSSALDRVTGPRWTIQRNPESLHSPGGVGKVGQAQGPLCDPTYPTQTALSVNSALTPAMRANATKSRPKPGPRLRGSSEGPATGTPASTSLAAGRPTRWRRALRCGAPTYGVTRRSETTARRIRRELVANASTS